MTKQIEVPFRLAISVAGHEIGHLDTTVTLDLGQSDEPPVVLSMQQRGYQTRMMRLGEVVQSALALAGGRVRGLAFEIHERLKLGPDPDVAELGRYLVWAVTVGELEGDLTRGRKFGRIEYNVRLKGMPPEAQPVSAADELPATVPATGRHTSALRVLTRYNGELDGTAVAVAARLLGIEEGAVTERELETARNVIDELEREALVEVTMIERPEAAPLWRVGLIYTGRQ